MKIVSPATALCVLGALMSPALAQVDVSARTSLSLELTSPSDIEVLSVDYRCDTIEPLTVQYINAAPNFLALVPVNDETLVFASVLSGSGARYTAATWVWWSSGTEASLYDLTLGEDAEPVATCGEANDIP
ncbi:hypothetical protein GCM10007989_08900 [Devosia pacifica]|uniref:C-type lysozyme inhibitor domain-containing protein n=1 Tax=Devosia pacifica TaxID=1335967 RepID=A0A918VRD0_9HYPH|nr:MliC family protein [Devosia pacifica]GHA16094.1 hypothetical protein GCM10007989_08900 [Devosia pacifica]